MQSPVIAVPTSSLTAPTSHASAPWTRHPYRFGGRAIGVMGEIELQPVCGTEGITLRTARKYIGTGSGKASRQRHSAEPAIHALCIGLPFARGPSRPSLGIKSRGTIYGASVNPRGERGLKHLDPEAARLACETCSVWLSSDRTRRTFKQGLPL